MINLTENDLDLVNSNTIKEENIGKYSNFSRSADYWYGSTPLNDATNYKYPGTGTGFTNPQSAYDHPSFMKKTATNKKMTEKWENSKTYFENGCKIIETTTKLIYSDGTTDENIDKRTIFLEE